MPEPIRQVTRIAAALPIENVDTDMIWPGSTGGSIRKGDQAIYAFRHMRFKLDGVEARLHPQPDAEMRGF